MTATATVNRREYTLVIDRTQRVNVLSNTSKSLYRVNMDAKDSGTGISLDGIDGIDALIDDLSKAKKMIEAGIKREQEAQAQN
jgi:hypothetical protein